ncbi:hypothetical protein [Desulfotalea psychrophila]|nr:hypothetical protein [Desulfotalea psychrophila]
MDYDSGERVEAPHANSEGAGAVEEQRQNPSIEVTAHRIWKISLAAGLVEECLREKYISLGYGDRVDFSGARNRQELIEMASLVADPVLEDADYSFDIARRFTQEMAKGDLLIISDGRDSLRAIAQVAGDYYYDETKGNYGQCRRVRWLNIFSPSRSRAKIVVKEFSQVPLYRLRPPIINLDRFQELVDESCLEGSRSLRSGDRIAGYEIMAIGDEIIEIKRGKGTVIFLMRIVIEELSQLVTSSQIMIEDIRERRVFAKVDTALEKSVLNGYANVLASLVEKNLRAGIRVDGVLI